MAELNFNVSDVPPGNLIETADGELILSALDAFDPACDAAEAVADEDDFEDAEIEMLPAVRRELASAWRIMQIGADKIGLFKRVASMLVPLCDTQGDVIAQRIGDELRDMADIARIETDEAQRIIASAAPTGETLLTEPEKKPEKSDEPLQTVSAAEFEGKPVPPRQWIVPGFIPDRNVTLLTGDGGTGKSLLALQLAAATTLIKVKWIGQPVTGGDVLYLSAEDELDEHHRRLFDILADYGCRFADLKNLEIIPLAGEDAVLAAPADRSEIIKATPLWRRLIKLIEIRRRKLVILDTLADLFAGNENSRPQARQFISMLRGVALKYDLAFVVLAHPSVIGIGQGTGRSGSTGWGNSVRSRIFYLSRVVTTEGESRFEPDPDLRVLTGTKTNYGRNGDEIRIRWEEGVFRPVEGSTPTGLDAMAKDAVADDAFLRLLRLHEEQKMEVSPNFCASYAPKVFAAHSQSAGIGKRAFKAAMERLLASKKIRVVEVGPSPSRKKKVLTCFREEESAE